MTAIIPLNSGNLPAYLRNNKALAASINKDVAVGVQYPTLSIKGKVWTLRQNNESKVLMKPDAPDEVLQNISLVVLRANTKSRVFYKGGFKEGDTERPTCQSEDGISPLPNALEPQAKKCQLCPKAVWGTRVGDDGQVREGTECSPSSRLAVADPDKLDKPMLLRVPPASRKAFADVVKAADNRGLPYNAMVVKVSFDHTAAAPKLVFTPTGLLSDEAYGKATEMYEAELTRDICGLNAPEAAAPAPAPVVSATEVEAALKPAAPAPAPAPVVAAPPPAPKVTPPAAKPTGMDNMLAELDALLGVKDD
jgi:hypothetical protein